ncbi:MAG: mucoidy inhibitor MuiA family protein [Phycisphaerales bacterium]
MTNRFATLGFALMATASSFAAPQAPIAEEAAAPILAESRIVAVTVYRDEAAITRRAEIELPPGTSLVRFLDVAPGMLVADSVQARIDGEAKVIEGVVREVPVADPEAQGRAGELDARIEAIGLEIGALEDDGKVLDGEWAFLETISARAGQQAAAGAGTEALDLGQVAEQMRFLAERRAGLLLRKRELAAILAERRRAKAALQSERQAIGGRIGSRLVQDVTVSFPSGGSATLDLLYRVDGASWRPAYRIRTDVAGNRTDLEYDALVEQATGEDWTDVVLELSTADPAVPTAPPEIEPVFVDVFVPPPPSRGKVESLALDAGRPMAAPGGGGFGGGGMEGGIFGDPGADAIAFDSGLAVAYRLPRPVSVPSDLEQTQRLRIDSIDAKPRLVFVSRPITETPPSLRATLENSTDLVLLPGDASIFVAGDYVGETELPAVQGRGKFEIFLGPEPRLEVVKQPTVRSTSTTGLFGGGRQTTLANRIELVNRLPRAVIVELWDRRPVSLNEKISVTVTDLSRPLDTDAGYLEKEAPQGLLKWTIALGAAGSTDAAATVVWTTKVAHSADVEITPIPE